MAWVDFGEHLARHQYPDEALAPLKRAIRFAPDYAPAHLKLGGALVSCGRAGEGAAAMRCALTIEPAFGAAWISLADIKTAPIADDEAEQMRELLRSRDVDESERTAIEFALAKVCEDHGRYHEAFELLMDANARRKCELGPWDTGQFLDRVRQAEEVFAGPPEAPNANAIGSPARVFGRLHGRSACAAIDHNPERPTASGCWSTCRRARSAGWVSERADDAVQSPPNLSFLRVPSMDVNSWTVRLSRKWLLSH